MRKVYARSFTLLAVLTGGTTAAAFAGCSDDNETATTPDGGLDAANDVSLTDGGAEDAAQQAMIARGKYLVDHVALCSDCHTPRGPSGPIADRYLAGTECFVDVNGSGDGGCLHSANLTNDPTGLKNHTTAEIRSMFMNGVKPDGKYLSPVMPYWVFHNMTSDDADAIVAYLRTVPGVEHRVPASDSPFDNVPVAATPIDPATIPAADGGSAEHGRYLSSMAGVCIECHTPELAPPSARPIDMTRPFAGGRGFQAAALNLPVPPFPNTIYTTNLTPHPTGLNGWTVEQIVRVLKQGRDENDAGVCPPMPAGPMGGFGGLTDQDAIDIATFIKGVPPIANTIPNECQAP